MLRISTIENEGGTRELRLSGSISGPWVRELHQSCEIALAEGAGVILDLQDVRYADYAGLALLSELKARRVNVIRSTPLVAELIASHEARSSGSKGENK